MEDDDEDSAGSHSEFEAESDFESEEEFSQQARKRDDVSKVMGEMIEIAKAASWWSHVENISESGSEAMSNSSEESSQSQPSQRKNIPQTVEEVANKECPVDDRNRPDAESKPESGSSVDGPIMDRYRARQVEMAIQSQLAEESGAVEETGQASDRDLSTLSFFSRTPSLPSEQEPAGNNQNLEETESRAQQASERGSSIYSALFAALSTKREPDPESEILEEAETLEAAESNKPDEAADAFLSTIPFPSVDRQSAGQNDPPKQTETLEANEPKDDDLEEGELSEGEIVEDKLYNDNQAVPHRRLADLRYEICQSSQHNTDPRRRGKGGARSEKQYRPPGHGYMDQGEGCYS